MAEIKPLAPKITVSKVLGTITEITVPYISYNTGILYARIVDPYTQNIIVDSLTCTISETNDTAIFNYNGNEIANNNIYYIQIAVNENGTLGYYSDYAPLEIVSSEPSSWFTLSFNSATRVVTLSSSIDKESSNYGVSAYLYSDIISEEKFFIDNNINFIINSSFPEGLYKANVTLNSGNRVNTAQAIYIKYIPVETQPPSSGYVAKLNDEEAYIELAYPNNITISSVYRYDITVDKIKDITNLLNNDRDFLIEQGHTYQYSINGEYTNTITADYEHIYLYDGERQLCIRYNPKISNFKTILLEQKTDALGGTYPLFFRNGDIVYKEIQINGLIEMSMDDQELFMNWKENNDDIRNDTPYYSDSIALASIVKNGSNLNFSGPQYSRIVYALADIPKMDANKIPYAKTEMDPINIYIPGYKALSYNQLRGYQDSWNSLNVIKNGFNINSFAPSYQIIFTTSDTNNSDELENIKKSILYYNPITNEKEKNNIINKYKISRDFNLEVLNWLNNGKPKVFKSPTEGCYIIRLMNTSLTPNDTLSRRICDFSTTGYECANFDLLTLEDLQ